MMVAEEVLCYSLQSSYQKYSWLFCLARSPLQEQCSYSLNNARLDCLSLNVFVIEKYYPSSISWLRLKTDEIGPEYWHSMKRFNCRNIALIQQSVDSRNFTASICSIHEF